MKKKIVLLLAGLSFVILAGCANTNQQAADSSTANEEVSDEFEEDSSMNVEDSYDISIEESEGEVGVLK